MQKINPKLKELVKRFPIGSKVVEDKDRTPSEIIDECGYAYVVGYGCDTELTYDEFGWLLLHHPDFDGHSGNAYGILGANLELYHQGEIQKKYGCTCWWDTGGCCQLLKE